MKSLSLALAAATVLIANALVVFHAQSNRSGAPDAEIVLSDRELQLNRPASDDDSSILLRILWTEHASSLPVPKWLNPPKLQSLGFDCNLDPSASTAWRFYGQQRPRKVYAAFEYAGPAWLAWAESVARESQTGNKVVAPVTPFNPDAASQLVAIDADLDPANLRARHPDRAQVIIVPAIASIRLYPYAAKNLSPNERSKLTIAGSISPANDEIHVPQPFADQFRKHAPGNPHVRVRLRYGPSFEPTVVAVEFAP